MSKKLNKKSKIFVTGHRGMVGSSLMRILKKKGYINLITAEKNTLDLRDQKKVISFLKKTKPDFLICAAAKVGGILANDRYKADFLYDNLAIQNNLIHGSYLSGIKNLIFLGSSCIYPKKSKIPIKENEILSGKLEQTNEPYAIAKIAGIKLCDAYNYQYNTNYISLMPCNLYGPNDNFDLTSSHFFPALIRKAYEANKNKKKHITIWGNGKAKRELMHVDDLAEACLFFMKKRVKHTMINIGSGYEMSITNYVKFILNRHSYNLKIVYDKSKPNGTERKLLNSSIANNYGWYPKISLSEGYDSIYKYFIKKYNVK